MELGMMYNGQREEEGEDFVGISHIHYFRQIVLKGMRNINSQANHPKRNNDMKKSLDFDFSSGASSTPNENPSAQSSFSSIYVSSLSQPSSPLSSSSSATTAEAVGEGGSMESISMEPLMLSGIYWTLSGLSILKVNPQKSDSSSSIDISSSSLRSRSTNSFETNKNIFSSADVPDINVFSCFISTTEFASSSSSDSNTSTLHLILDNQLFNSLFSFVSTCRQKLPTPLLPIFLCPPKSTANNSQIKGFAPWGFSSCPGCLIPYTASLLSSMSALQILSLLCWSSSSSSSIDRRNIITKSFGDWGGMRSFIKFLQTLPSGHFSNFSDSRSGRREGDVRFAFCAVAAMRLIQGLSLESSRRKQNNDNNNNLELNSSDNATGMIDVVSLNEWILSCQNIDGGFGCSPGMESHAGTTFCCLATLTLLDSLESLNQDGKSRRLQRWLGDRQLFCGGGVNGRPGKTSDVCYSWWVVASLRMLNIPLEEVFDTDEIIDFILSCQNRKMGGFSRNERPGMMEEEEMIVENNITRTSGEFKNSSASNPFSIFNLRTHEMNKESLTQQEDPFHSFFALGALSLIVHEKCEKKIEEEDLKTKLVGFERNLRRRERLRRQLLEIHPVFALPLTLVQEFGLI